MSVNTELTRPVLRWHGGKWLLAPWIIENLPPHRVYAHDTDEALHYVDPPYLPDTRDAGGDYAHELTADDHEKLLAFLRGLKGAVVLSGYPHSLYDAALPGWTRIERHAFADGARARTEVLWINPQGERRLHRSRGLFGTAA